MAIANTNILYYCTGGRCGVKCILNLLSFCPSHERGVGARMLSQVMPQSENSIPNALCTPYCTVLVFEVEKSRSE